MIAVHGLLKQQQQAQYHCDFVYKLHIIIYTELLNVCEHKYIAVQIYYIHIYNLLIS